MKSRSLKVSAIIELGSEMLKVVLLDLIIK